ncbi:MAG TPA: DUF2442 domain-containing protein [Acetobacteraceae bacterium]|jgi:hypothetical protein|nr:DUF2442 domain-containing protein [Acetobacteraceae bacterium]
MGTSAATPEAIATDVSSSKYQLHVSLTDGREIVVPLAWFPQMLKASPTQRANWRLIGRGIHRTDVDEDISVAGLLQPS